MAKGTSYGQFDLGRAVQVAKPHDGKLANDPFLSVEREESDARVVHRSTASRLGDNETTLYECLAFMSAGRVPSEAWKILRDEGHWRTAG